MGDAECPTNRAAFVPEKCAYQDPDLDWCFYATISRSSLSESRLMYRIVLAWTDIPTDEGPPGAF